MGFKASEKPILESEYGPLTDTGITKVISHLQEHKGTASCPACYGDDWTVQRELLFLKHWHETGRGMVFVIVTCDACANARMFAAILMGVVEDD